MIRPRVCFAIQREIPRLIEIDEESYLPSAMWTAAEFERVIYSRDYLCFCVYVGDQLAGYIVCKPLKIEYLILKIAVHPDWRRHGVGATMIHKIKRKLNQSRKAIVKIVRESNTAGQLFLRGLGFAAVDTERHWHNDTQEDAYVMAYEAKGKQKTDRTNGPENL